MISCSGGSGVWNSTSAAPVFAITVTGEKTFTYVSTGNGTPTGCSSAQIISPMTVRVPNNGQNILYPYSLVAYLDGMSLNDSYDLYVYTPTAGDLITVSDLNWYFEAR